MSAVAEVPKSEMLRRSMRCFTLGCWSLVPVAGLIPALLAFVDFRAVVVGMGNRWNAGRTFLLIGIWLTGIGVLISVIVMALIALVILRAYIEA